MRERLIELLDEVHHTHLGREYIERLGTIADYLLANGVIVPLCTAMDIVYIAIDSPKPQVEKKVVESVTFGTYNDTVTFTDKTCFTLWGKSWERYYRSVFLTREEAEQALRQRKEDEGK